MAKDSQGFRTDAYRFGFDWPEQKNERIPPPGLAENIKGPRIQVTRTGQVNRGKRGTWRILEVLTVRQRLNIYVTPSGMCRVFDKDGVEWKPVAYHATSALGRDLAKEANSGN